MGGGGGQGGCDRRIEVIVKRKKSWEWAGGGGPVGGGGGQGGCDRRIEVIVKMQKKSWGSGWMLIEVLNLLLLLR